MSNVIVTQGGMKPGVVNTPLDCRTRVDSVDEIYNIEVPYVGMLVYCTSDDTYYKITSLKPKKIGPINVADSLVNEFVVFAVGGEGLGLNNPQFFGSVMAGDNCYREGDNSVVFGSNSSATGNNSFAVGETALASGNNSFASGHRVQATGMNSNSEGYASVASGDASHAEGHACVASGYAAHSEGFDCEAIGEYSHAEGYSTKAEGERSHAEGYSSEALGNYSHAEGRSCTTQAECAHAEGYGCVAKGAYQHVQGKYNEYDNAGKYLHIVGNGSSTANRSNAHTVDWEGNAWYAGDVFIGEDNDKLIRESELLAIIARLEARIAELENNSISIGIDDEEE